VTTLQGFKVLLFCRTHAQSCSATKIVSTFYHFDFLSNESAFGYTVVEIFPIKCLAEVGRFLARLHLDIARRRREIRLFASRADQTVQPGYAVAGENRDGGGLWGFSCRAGASSGGWNKADSSKDKRLSLQSSRGHTHRARSPQTTPGERREVESRAIRGLDERAFASKSVARRVLRCFRVYPIERQRPEATWSELLALSSHRHNRLLPMMER